MHIKLCGIGKPNHSFHCQFMTLNALMEQSQYSGKSGKGLKMAAGILMEHLVAKRMRMAKIHVQFDLEKASVKPCLTRKIESTTMPRVQITTSMDFLADSNAELAGSFVGITLSLCRLLKSRSSMASSFVANVRVQILNKW